MMVLPLLHILVQQEELCQSHLTLVHELQASWSQMIQTGW